MPTKKKSTTFCDKRKFNGISNEKLSPEQMKSFSWKLGTENKLHW